LPRVMFRAAVTAVAPSFIGVIGGWIDRPGQADREAYYTPMSRIADHYHVELVPWGSRSPASHSHLRYVWEAPSRWRGAPKTHLTAGTPTHGLQVIDANSGNVVSRELPPRYDAYTSAERRDAIRRLRCTDDSPSSPLGFWPWNVPVRTLAD